MNELMNRFDISSLDDQDLDFIQQQIMDRKFKAMIARMEQAENFMVKVGEKVDIIHTELNNKFEDMKNDNNKKTDVAINSMRLGNQKYEYISQNDFGAAFRVKIGAKMVGKLFRIIGIAKESKSRTEPYANFVPAYAISDPVETQYGSRINYRWNYAKCLNKLEEWLEEHNYKEEFYSIETERKMTQFINELYDTYM